MFNRHEYYKKHRKHELEYAALYRRLHPDKVKNAQARWLAENHDKAIEASRLWRLNHPDKQAKAKSRWNESNKDRVNAMHQARRFRLLGNGGKYTDKEWKSLCKLFDNRCASCGKRKKLTVDHVVPLILGGTNDITNIQPLCKSCNSHKHVKIIDYRTK